MKNISDIEFVKPDVKSHSFVIFKISPNTYYAQRTQAGTCKYASAKTLCKFPGSEIIYKTDYTPGSVTLLNKLKAHKDVVVKNNKIYFDGEEEEFINILNTL